MAKEFGSKKSTLECEEWPRASIVYLITEGKKPWRIVAEMETAKAYTDGSSGNSPLDTITATEDDDLSDDDKLDLDKIRKHLTAFLGRRLKGKP